MFVKEAKSRVMWSKLSFLVLHGIKNKIIE